jgi:hypothetical protein
MPLPTGAIGAIGDVASAGLGLLGGWLQQRAAKKAAEEQRRAGTAAADRLTSVADGSANRIVDTGTAAAAGIENAGGAAQAGIGEAGRIGQGQLAGAISNFQPYSDAGRDALARLSAGTAKGGEFDTTFTGSTDGFLNEAGVKYRTDHAVNAIQNSYAGKGLIGSNTVNDINKEVQGIASDEYGRAFDRSRTTYQMNRDNALNPLNFLVSSGATANANILNGTNEMANMGVDTARTVGGIGLQTAQGAGDYRTAAQRAAEGVRMGAESQGADLRTGAAASGAAGTIGAANAWSDALSGVNRGIDWAELLRRRTPAGGIAQVPTISPGVYATGGGSGG